MTLQGAHQEAQNFSAQARQLAALGDQDKAIDIFSRAAQMELLALQAIGADKPRTRGIIGVSAAALFCKAEDREKAEELACRLLAEPSLPEFARAELKDILRRLKCEAF